MIGFPEHLAKRIGHLDIENEGKTLIDFLGQSSPTYPSPNELETFFGYKYLQSSLLPHDKPIQTPTIYHDAKSIASNPTRDP